MRYAVPPMGWILDEVSSLYTLSIAPEMCSNAAMNVDSLSCMMASKASAASLVLLRESSSASTCSASFSLRPSYCSIAFMLGSKRARSAAFSSTASLSSWSSRSLSLGLGAFLRRSGRFS